mgnify:CR=1 FL=1|tara:strand:+ start:4941 stop:5345 length:405 start_codon:yes stop_codon:yes gene_type:complete
MRLGRYLQTTVFGMIQQTSVELKKQQNDGISDDQRPVTILHKADGVIGVLIGWLVADIQRFVFNDDRSGGSGPDQRAAHGGCDLQMGSGFSIPKKTALPPFPDYDEDVTATQYKNSFGLRNDLSSLKVALSFEI